MNLLYSFEIILIVIQLNQRIEAFTHWIVTENGRIEPKLDTHFYLRRPYDLLALLEQEKRRDDLDNLMNDLVKHRKRIDKKTLDASLAVINDCSEFLKTIALLSASNATDRIKYKFEADVMSSDTQPHCTKYYQLDYSIFAYDHLDSVQNRKEHTLNSCDGCLSDMQWNILQNNIMHGLERNSTSWLHYNLGFLYWWKMGDFNEAIECARRALYFVPDSYKDIPLANLGLLLFISHTDDALILLKSAVDHLPTEPRNYLLLARLYLNLGIYDKGLNSIKKYKSLQTGKLPDFEIEKFIKCNLNSQNGISEYYDVLQDILSDWHEYHSRQQRWLSLQERLLWEMAPYDLSFTSNFDNKIDLEKNHCQSDFDNDCKLNMKKIPNLQLPNKKMVQQWFNEKYNSIMTSGKNNFDGAPKKDAIEMDGNIKLSPPKYPTTMKLSNNLYFDDIKWPSQDECIQWNLPLKEKERYDLPIFLPPENKGFPIKEILSDYINVPENVEHDLPWYPPLCHDLEVKDSIMLGTHDFLRKHFLSYINNGNSNEAEIGQRIVTARKMKSAPSWLLSILSSMYWRTKDNTKNAYAHTCMHYISTEPIPEEFLDIVFVSMASMFQQIGYIDQALEIAKGAFEVNYLEPSTNFLLAILHYQKNNPISAMHYLKNVLRVDPDYYDGEADRLLKLWACRIKLGSYENTAEEKKGKPEEMCSSDNVQSEGVVCSPNGEQCKTAAIHCFRADHESAAIKPQILSPSTSQNCQSDLLNNIHHGVDNIVNLLSTDLQMRIFVGVEYSQTFSQREDVVATLRETEVQKFRFLVHDKSGTYTLSKSLCEEIIEADWLQFTSMWNILAVRDVDFSIKPFISSLTKSTKKPIQPYCIVNTSTLSANLNNLIDSVLKRKIPNVAEESLSEWLALMAGDQESSVRELGEKIGIALKENNTSWLLATAAALYWRVIGNSQEAVVCLQQALAYVPQDMENIPLINLANVLNKVQMFVEALEVTQIAMENQPKQFVNHFTAGNIYTSMGDYEKAIFFYRWALVLDPNFEPARNRLQAIICTFIFDENGALRDNDVFNN